MSAIGLFLGSEIGEEVEDIPDGKTGQATRGARYGELTRVARMEVHGFIIRQRIGQ